VLKVDSNGSRPPGRGGDSPAAVTVKARAGTYDRKGSWCFTAPTRNDSVPWLRHTVRDLLRREGVPEELLENLLLILSELTTNAVQHAALFSPEMGVEVSLVGGWLRVAVEDGHPYRPKGCDELPDDEHDGGRGLLLVEAITAQSGGVCDTTPTGTGGKVVWAALPLPRGESSSRTEPSSRADGALPSAVTSRPWRP
jgi:anti-sigma regulatory factor (Ser/Thr protein kinase)